jgi:hypothetical protein
MGSRKEDITIKALSRYSTPEVTNINNLRQVFWRIHSNAFPLYSIFEILIVALSFEHTIRITEQDIQLREQLRH